MTSTVHPLFRVEEPTDALEIPPPPVPMVRRKPAVTGPTEQDDPRQLGFWSLHAVAKRLSRRGAA